MISEINLCGVSISTYWLAIFAGAVAMFVLMLHRREIFGLSTVKTVVFTVLLTICGLLGTKLLYVIEYFEEIKATGLTLGGLSFYGAVFLVPVLMPLACKALSMTRTQANDASSLCGLIMLGSMRVGCFLQNCCGGVAVTLGDLHFRWPTQAIESIGDFAILAVLYKMEKQHRFSGKLYPLFMICYSVMRFFVEFLRDTPKNLIYLSRGQWYALSAIATGALWLVIRSRKDAHA